MTEAAFDPGDGNHARDVYVRDRAGATTRWAAPGSVRAGSADPALSGDGRYVLFETPSRLVATDVDSFADVYRFELATATTTLASIDTWYMRQGDGPASRPSSSTNGYVVAFTSAGGLIPTTPTRQSTCSSRCSTRRARRSRFSGSSRWSGRT